MSAIYNPESETIAQIERLERDARDLRRKIDLTRGQEDKRALAKLLKELDQQITHLRSRVP